jgi:Rrf2 family protein
VRLQLTKRTDYAIRASLALARNPTQTMSSVQIAQRMGIPVHFTSQVMSDLVRAGVARAVIGRTGGYRLACDPSAVSVLRIVEAVEGDPRRRLCVLRGGPCERAQPCAIHHVFAGAQEAFVAELAATSLGDIAASD